MAHAKLAIEVGSQVYLSEGGEEVGAVREVTPDRIVIYIEGAGDFVIGPLEVQGAHDGKLILESSRLDTRLLDAIRHAHDRETD